MSTMPYQVSVTVGRGANVHTWSISQGAPADYGPLSGLTITRDVLDDLWPPTDAPAECRLQILAETFADVPYVRLGNLVQVIVSATAGGTVIGRFNGRISDLKAAPHPLGVLLTLGCVDFTADLRDATIGVPGPNDLSDPTYTSSGYDRIAYFVRRLGYSAMAAKPANFYPNTLARVNDKPYYTNAYDHIQGILRESYFDLASTTGGYARPVLVPVLGNGPMNPPTSWSIEARAENPAYTGPLLLTYSGGTWSAVVTAAAGATILPAAAIDFASQYAETRDGSVNRVTVNPAPDATDPYTATLGIDPQVTLTIDTEHTEFATLVALANLYLPDSPPVSTWMADAFTYYCAADLPGTAVPDDLGPVVTIAGIPSALNPTGRTYYAGRVARRVLTVAASQVAIEVQLRRPDFAPNPTGVVLLNSPILTTPGSGRPQPTFANIDPTLTLDDARLIRGALT